MKKTWCFFVREWGKPLRSLCGNRTVGDGKGYAYMSTWMSLNEFNFRAETDKFFCYDCVKEHIRRYRERAEEHIQSWKAITEKRPDYK